MKRSWVVLALAALTACAKAAGQAPDAAPPDTAPRPIDAAIDGNSCTVQPCSILPQCGCNPNFACDVDTNDNMGTACRSVTMPGTETAACNSLDDCAAGYVCLGGSAYASCKNYCSADADCGTPRGRCVIEISSGGMPIAGIPRACSSNCDPQSVNPPECPSTYKCGLFSVRQGTTTHKIADCSPAAPAGTGLQGTDCKAGTLGNDALCGKGFLCTTVNAGTNYNCRRICNKTMNTGCPTGTSCLAFDPAHTIGLVEYGVCD